MKLRDEDIREIQTASGEENVHQVILDGLTEDTYIGFMDGEPFVLYGVCKHSSFSGIVWAVTTDAMESHKIASAKWTLKAVQELHESTSILLTNTVDSRNTKHINWLKWAGFSFEGEQTVNGVKFLIFYKIRER